MSTADTAARGEVEIRVTNAILQQMEANRLYYGDNLDVLREHIPDESVDLIYLDPPFNSNANYNLLFKSPSGKSSEASVEAFVDTWHWGEQAEREYDSIVTGRNRIQELMRALMGLLGRNDMMAYLTMMANRLLELHRVLKPTGSLYLHCDPVASHYLKIVLDGIFNTDMFQNEIIWKRTNAHNFKTKGYVRSNDTILYYVKSTKYVFNSQYTDYSKEQLDRYKLDETGRLYKAENLTFSTKNPSRQFGWRGTKPPDNRSWGASEEQLEKWLSEGRILLKKDGTPRLDGLKVYLDDMHGKPLTTNWDDIERIGNTSKERLGYPTQKPLALLERIIKVSSNEGNVVLDPFCGCGTAVHAAEKLGRKWIGIDITHLAIALIEKRMKDAFPSIQFEVKGTPQDYEAAVDLARRDKYQFQWWACSLVGAQPFKDKKKGADGGIDGTIYFKDVSDGEFQKIIISVKGGDNIGVAMVKDLIATVEREKAAIGLFVTLRKPTRVMETEALSAGYYVNPFNKQKHNRIQILTIEGLLTGTDSPNYPNMTGDFTLKAIGREAKSDGSTPLTIPGT